MAEIVVVDQLGGTPYLGYAIQAHAALVRDGDSVSHVQMVGWDNKAVVALLEGKVVGIITYADSKHVKEWNILIGFVDPDRRKEGIYKQMWAKLVQQARLKDVYRIT